MIADILSALIKRADNIGEEIADLEEILEQRKADRDRILSEDIPAVLHEHGLASAPLADGRTITIEQMVSVKQIDKDALRAWLERHQYDSIIRTEFDFGKGTDLSEVEDILARRGIDYEKSTEIHPMSLKAVVRRHIEEGGEYPPEGACTVSIYERAKVKEAR